MPLVDVSVPMLVAFKELVQDPLVPLSLLRHHPMALEYSSDRRDVGNEYHADELICCPKLG